MLKDADHIYVLRNNIQDHLCYTKVSVKVYDGL